MIGRRTFLQVLGLSVYPVSKSVSTQLDLPHNGLQQARLDRMPERIYAKAWKKVNKRRPAVNSGFAALEWILCPSGQLYPSVVSKRDAEVAASVIQWLGTNCGFHFVLKCERKIKEEQE